jgi:hypothetical protein
MNKKSSDAMIMLRLRSTCASPTTAAPASDVARAIGKIVGLGDRQRIHVGTQVDGGSVAGPQQPTTPFLPT